MEKTEIKYPEAKDKLNFKKITYIDNHGVKRICYKIGYTKQNI